MIYLITNALRLLLISKSRIYLPVRTVRKQEAAEAVLHWHGIYPKASVNGKERILRSLEPLII